MTRTAAPTAAARTATTASPRRAPSWRSCGPSGGGREAEREAEAPAQEARGGRGALEEYAVAGGGGGGGGEGGEAASGGSARQPVRRRERRARRRGGGARAQGDGIDISDFSIRADSVEFFSGARLRCAPATGTGSSRPTARARRRRSSTSPTASCAGCPRASTCSMSSRRSRVEPAGHRPVARRRHAARRCWPRRSSRRGSRRSPTAAATTRRRSRRATRWLPCTTS